MVSDRKLPTRTKAAFGIGQVGDATYGLAFGAVLFYYNVALGLSGTLTGLAIGLCILFDAVTDPLIASISDRFRSKWGRRHPFMYLSIIPLGLAIFFLLVPPQSIHGSDVLFWWLLVFGMASRGALTLFAIPHMSLTAELSSDHNERTSLASWRMLMGYIGGFIFFVVTFNIFFADEINPDTGEIVRRGAAIIERYVPYALTASIIIIVTLTICTFGTHNQIRHLPQNLASDPKMRPFDFVRDAAQALTIKPFLMVFTGLMVFYFISQIGSVFTTYMGLYFWEMSVLQISIFGASIQVGVVIGAIIAPALSRRYDRGPIYFWAMAVLIIFSAVPTTLRLLDWIPGNDNPIVFYIVLGNTIFVFIFAGIATVSADAMLADITDVDELKFGRRREGVFFAARSFSTKTAASLAKVIGGVLLDLIAFPRREGLTTADIPTDTIFNLGVITGPATMLVTLPALYFLWKYDLTRKKHKEVLEELAERRAANGTVAQAPAE